MALQLRTGSSGLRCCEKGFAHYVQCTGWAARANSYLWRGVGTAKPHHPSIYPPCDHCSRTVAARQLQRAEPRKGRGSG
ncbi:hypothetical protein EI541_04010 [Xanthomonas citri pv. eucalyptorum]|nr:hypothetical protein EI541_04010 [Xanthomonas axonopodis pv. eucalyptorum]